MIDTSSFKKGVCLQLRGEPVIIVDYQVSTPTCLLYTSDAADE